MFNYENAAKSIMVENFLFSSDLKIVKSVCTEYLTGSREYFEAFISLERLGNLCSLLTRFCLDNEDEGAEDLLSRVDFICDWIKADYARREFIYSNGVISSDAFPVEWYDPNCKEGPIFPEWRIN